MAVEDEEVAKSYLAKREDKEQFAYFMYKEGEKTEYIVIYGNFVTMELALGVADTTDFSLPEGIRAGPEKFMTYVPHVGAEVGIQIDSTFIKVTGKGIHGDRLLSLTRAT